MAALFVDVCAFSLVVASGHYSVTVMLELLPVVVSRVAGCGLESRQGLLGAGQCGLVVLAFFVYAAFLF